MDQTVSGLQVVVPRIAESVLLDSDVDAIRLTGTVARNLILESNLAAELARTAFEEQIELEIKKEYETKLSQIEAKAKELEDKLKS